MYRALLEASIDCLRFRLLQGLPACGHDESETSLNRANFIELLKYTAKHDEKVRKVVLENAWGNTQMIAPSIQKISSMLVQKRQLK